MSINTETVDITDVAIGDQIRFTPDSRPRAWWTVIDRNPEHIVAVRQAPFEPKGTLEYTVTGHMNGQRNGAGPGLVRSSLNTLGGGWDLSNRDGGAGPEGILAALESGKYELSMRRVVDVQTIERNARATARGVLISEGAKA